MIYKNVPYSYVEYLFIVFNNEFIYIPNLSGCYLFIKVLSKFIRRLPFLRCYHNYQVFFILSLIS